MLRSKIVLAVLVLGMTFAGAPAKAAPVTWEIGFASLSDGGSISGSFIYDAATDIYSFWNIVTTSGSNLAGFNYLNSNSTPQSGSGATSLSLVASGSTLNLLFGPGLDAGSSFVDLSGDETSTGQQRTISEGLAFPLAAPIPGALPLFASGLGALGLLCWRRKRKPARLAA